MTREQDSFPAEEIRFAVVLNGGVSLAVWMGGAVLELNRVTQGDSVYGHLLRMVGCTARADVITGTSAGGINGAALALAQVNRCARLDRLRHLWSEQGRMDQLLRTPFHGQPVSLLRGDEFFLPRLEEALGQLATGWDPRPPGERPIDLRITTTLLQPVPEVTFDDLGQALTQANHQCTFSFRRDAADWAYPARGQYRDDFQEPDLADRVAQLALAARSSASFPFAFEPSYVPVHAAYRDGRPDMARVASWATGEADQSRYAVDGGVLVNTPTRQALEAIHRMPAGGPVRRVMLLVFPHAEPAGPDRPADLPSPPPSTLATGGRLLGALRSQGARTYVEKIEEHNRLAASQRGSREELLDRLAGQGDTPVASALYSLAGALLPHYRDLRIRRAARDLASRQLAITGSNTAKWSFERVRAAAEQAQRDWVAGGCELPYVPLAAPPAVEDDVSGANKGWRWGFGMVEELASAVMDLLERLVWVVPDTAHGTLAGGSARIADARERVHRARFEVGQLREALDRKWTGPDSPTLGVLYWADRLAVFKDVMTGSSRGEIGSKIRAQVDAIGDAVVDAQRVLVALDGVQREVGGLRSWYELLDPDLVAEEEDTALCGSRLTAPHVGPAAEPRPSAQWRPVWLSRLLALQVATTCLADEARTGHDQAVELAQISLQTDNAFAEYSTTPDDKAAGTALGRFGGFLKRSWRVNDWVWGRMDGATTLCRILLDQRRLRRVAMLRGKVITSGNQAELDERVEQELDAFAKAVLGASVVDLFAHDEFREPSLQQAVRDARAELRLVYDDRVASGNLDACSPGLATLAAWGLHARIAAEELPHLRAAVDADRIDGADPRSNGVRFVAEHGELISRLGSDEPTDEVTVVRRGIRALKAFDRAGVGRESVEQEVSSDQSLRTAATAAAVVVTVADSENSGLRVLRPVTRAVRGAALLPYWAVVGLARGSRVARLLGVLGLALGGFALALALFGVLPGGTGRLAAAFGTAALLGAFGYAALRTGTVLHGVALLSPVLPLVGYALQKSGDSGPASPSVSTTTGILLVVLGLVAIGSLPSPMRTPLAALARRRTPPSATEITSPGRLVTLVAVVMLAAVVVIGVVSGRPEVLWVGGSVAVLLTAAATTACLSGMRLRRWCRRGKLWAVEEAAHPAAVTAGWGVVYGSVFLAAAGLLVLFGPGWDGVGGTVARWLDRDRWTIGALITSMLLAAVFLLLTPWFLPLRARRRLNRELLAEATTTLYQDREQTPDVLWSLLEGRGLLYCYLTRKGCPDPELNRSGRQLVKRIQDHLWPPDTPPRTETPVGGTASSPPCSTGPRRRGHPGRPQRSPHPAHERDHGTLDP